MQLGLATSTALHAGVLVLTLVSFSGAKPFEPMPESLPVDVISISDYTKLTKGAKNGQKAEFTIVYNAKDSLRQALALAVSGMLKKVGISAVVKGTNWDDIKKNLTHSNVVVYGFGDHSPLEMYKLHHSRKDLNIYNAGFYANPAVDENLDKAMAAASFDASIPCWKAAQWDGKTGFGFPGDAAWAWLVNLDHTYFIDENLDVGRSQMEPHGHGWPITTNIEEWKWIGK